MEKKSRPKKKQENKISKNSLFFFSLLSDLNKKIMHVQRKDSTKSNRKKTQFVSNLSFSCIHVLYLVN